MLLCALNLEGIVNGFECYNPVILGKEKVQ